MPLKQLAYVPNHVNLTREVAVDLLIKPTAKVKDLRTVHVKLSGHHADELFTIEEAGFARNRNKPPTQLFGISLTIDEDGNGSSVYAQL
jgi:hypothetical protein